MDRNPGGFRECPPDQECKDTNKEREKEIRHLHHRLAQRFHPDIDGINLSESEWRKRNEMLAHVNGLAQEAEEGKDEALQELRDLYQEHVLKEEQEEKEEIKETVDDLKPRLERLQARFRDYLLLEDENEWQTVLEEWEKEWQALSEEDQERLKIIAEIHRSLLELRATLQAYAEFKDFTPNRRQAQAEVMLEALGEKMGEIMEQFERDQEPLDPSAITQALAGFIQQVAAQIQAMTDEMKPAEAEGKAKKEEKKAEKEGEEREEFDAGDDDLEAEETALPAKPAPTSVKKKDEEEEDKKNLLPLLLAAGAYMLVNEETGENEVVPRDKEHREHLNELKQKNFIDGVWRGGKFLVKRQVLPWCTAPRDVFLLLNLRHYGLFPGSFRHLQRPGADEYFPEAAFLDTTGRALTEYVNGRWEEYLRSPEYRAYLQEFGFDEEERVAVVDD